jgi:hypothetical protein
VLRELLLPLALAMVAVQLPLLALARWLGRPLRRTAIAAGLLLPLVLLAPWLDADRLLAPCNVLAGTVPGYTRYARMPAPHSPLNDAVYQLLPWELEVRRALGSGRLPLWSDLVDGGSSPWSNPQAQVLSPLAMLARAAPLQHHLLVLLALAMVVGFQGTWVLCRALGCRNVPALLGATSFALGGGLIAWSLFPLGATAAWAPWVVAGVLALARRRKTRSRRRAAIALVLVTAALALAGHPETATGAIALAALVGLSLRQRRRVPLARLLASAACAGALGLGLAAPQLVPFAATAARSLRAGERVALRPPALPGWRVPLGDWFAEGGWQIWRGPLSPLAFGVPYGPRFAGPWTWPVASASYAGMLALAGGAAALAGRRRRIALPLIAAWLGSLLLASRFLPLEALLFRLPLLRLPEPTRFLPLGCLALAAAAAIGCEGLRRGRAATRAAALLVLVAGVVVTPLPPVVAHAGALALAALLAARARRFASLLAAGALLVGALPWARAHLPADEPALFYPRTDAIGAVEGATREGRAIGDHLVAYPSLLGVYGIADPRAHNPLAPRSQLAALAALGFSPSSQRYFSAVEHPEHPLLDFLAVQVVIAHRHVPRQMQRMQRWSDLERVASPYLYFRNPGALPLWFLAAGVEAVPAGEVPLRLAALRDGRVVVLDRHEVGAWRPAPQPWRRDAVRALSRQPGRLTLAVGGDGERLLATSLPGPSGWRAEAGGRALPLLTVNSGYLGVRVTSGVERVELRYRPPGLLTGLVLAVLAALAATALAGLAWRAPSTVTPVARSW